MNRKAQKSKCKTLKALVSSMRLFLTLVFCLLSFLGCGNLSRVRYGQETVKMAVLPVYSLSLMHQRYQPLLRYLSNETGYDVQYLTSSNYRAYGATVQGSHAQLIFCDPLNFLILRKTAGAEAVAAGVARDGGREVQGLIIVRKNSRITTLEELRNVRVGIASQLSAEGFLSQAVTLSEAGIDAQRQLKLIPCQRMDEVINQLGQGKLEAGFIGSASWQDTLEGKFRILARTQSVPGWICAAMPDIDPEIKDKIALALLSLDRSKEEAARVLEGLKLSGFVKPEWEILNRLEQMARRAGLPI